MQVQYPDVNQRARMDCVRDEGHYGDYPAGGKAIKQSSLSEGLMGRTSSEDLAMTNVSAVRSRGVCNHTGVDGIHHEHFDHGLDPTEGTTSLGMSQRK
jgi:hypothetical protein